MLVIYGKESCQQCDMAKMYCDMNGIEYTYKMLGKDYELTDLKSIIPDNHKSFPVIIKFGKYLGGYKELKNV